MAASMASSSLPAWPTKGWPWRSSFSPGASPMTIQSALRAPTPNTVCVRPAHRPQARQAATAASSCGQSMSATPSGRGPRAVADWDSGAGVALCGGAAGRGRGAEGAAGTRATGGAAAAGRADSASNRSSAPAWSALEATISGVAGAALGNHSLMPISASMARWRSSSCKVMRRLPGAGSSPRRLRAGRGRRGSSPCAGPRA